MTVKQFINTELYKELNSGNYTILVAKPHINEFIRDRKKIFVGVGVGMGGMDIAAATETALENVKDQVGGLTFDRRIVFIKGNILKSDLYVANRALWDSNLFSENGAETLMGFGYADKDEEKIVVYVAVV